MNDFALPATRYALSGDVSIAYQVIGDGPIDLVMVPGVISHVEFMHELPGYTAFLRRLSNFARVITFDKRGQKRAVLMGFSEGCAMSALFAATYPERASNLLLFGGFSLSAMAGDFEKKTAERLKNWGSGNSIRMAWPSLLATPQGIDSLAKLERLAASPGAIKALTLLNAQIDVRPILPAIQVPTLVLHRRGGPPGPNRGRPRSRQANTGRQIHRIYGRRSRVLVRGR